jgi:hypothetical protein
MLTKNQFTAMASGEKERYTSKILKRILEQNQNGVTLGQIDKNTYFNKATIWRHLEKLVTTREAYKLEFGRVSVYYANGKLIRPLFSEDITVGEKVYPIFFVRNNLGDFVYLQEKKEDRLGRAEVCGGLIIPLSQTETFAKRLLQVNTKVREVLKNATD